MIVPVWRPRRMVIFLVADREVFARQRRQFFDAAGLDGRGDVALAHRAGGRFAAHHVEGGERGRRLSQFVEPVEGREVPGHQFVVERVVDRAVALVVHDAREHRPDREFHVLAHDERAQVVLVGDVYAAVIVIFDVFVVASRAEECEQPAVLQVYFS
ncbi:MAG: hypothetical protein V8Q54_04570 [Alistipes senegalensis]